jgi:hypothetical protein
MNTPYVPVLMTALTELRRIAWSGRLPNVVAGQPFWAKRSDYQPLIDAGYARAWADGDPPAPAPEPPWTVHGSPGLATGTTNASH